MYTLFIDTHSKYAKTVLFKDEKVLLKKESMSDNSHSSVLVNLIKEILKETNIEPNNLNEILVVNGPGSFTGIRIGITVAKTLAFSLHIPIKELDYFNVLVSGNKLKTEKQIVISDPKGFYVALFDENNIAISEFKYVLKSMFKKNLIPLIDENSVIDYEEVYRYSKKLNSKTSHAIKPLYIKKIEVEK